MAEKGWHLDCQQFPDSLHLTISRGNAEVVDEFIRDLNEVMGQTEKLEAESKSAKFTTRAARVASKLLPGKTIGKLVTRLSGKEKSSDGDHKPANRLPFMDYRESEKSWQSHRCHCRDAG